MGETVLPGEATALFGLLLSTLAHQAHHGGQIYYLKGLQEAKDRSGPNRARKK